MFEIFFLFPVFGVLRLTLKTELTTPKGSDHVPTYFTIILVCDKCLILLGYPNSEIASSSQN